MKKIILASASPRRSELLKQIHLEFSVIPANVEENFAEGASPQDIVSGLSLQKAKSVADTIKEEAIVIGADTVVAGKTILGKPRDRQEAYDMLSSLSGAWHEVITGVALVDADSGKCISEYEITRVKIRDLSNDIIEAYIKTGEPMDKAGAYGIQGMGALLVEKIEGCYFNVVGLPLVRLSNMFEQFGIYVMQSFSMPNKALA